MTPPRRLLDAGLAAALAGVALLTLLPSGHGWQWGPPIAELRWYVTGWSSGTAMVQLFGNLALLGPLAALAAGRAAQRHGGGAGGPRRRTAAPARRRRTDRGRLTVG